ncbi:MAG TPA: molybdopterin-dependent oxidoreductase [Tepidisphaeraceae bacterium]|jgi:DMSO/TMAO reductase YedYZ molybdopterin-dependent catalytic subunit|nr:molybdopterin-dependent oxidoreductase [Tepidisphaeraceae bacterium]
MKASISRREAIYVGVTAAIASAAGKADAGAGNEATAAAPAAAGMDPAKCRPLLTRAKDFEDVSRGHPIPHTLNAQGLINARLTPETWRLEVVAEEGATIEKPMQLSDNTALNLAALLKLGERHGVRFLKAMQCNNIALPLGQGLWEGVPLRDVLGACGVLNEVRRVFYWGFHNDDPKQMFRSSLALSQVLDTPPGALPPFVAYRLNGEPIPPVRGGPVRMVVPWAHGFKSVKWLQKVVLTNNYQANDTYALAKNDPESYLKTAAYFDDTRPSTFAANAPIEIRGTAMTGWPGLDRIEYWIRPDPGDKKDLADTDPVWAGAEWKPAAIEPPPADWGGGLPAGISPKDVWGFAAAGRPREWPMRYSVAHWRAWLVDLKPGRYEMRVRTIDGNGYAQPLPRPNQRTGRNRVQSKVIVVGAG